MKFLDQVKIFIKAGNGGNGCVAFRREKFIEFGGPNGGDGGSGGSIIIKAVNGLNTLVDYRYAQHHKAANGSNGSGNNKTGHAGKDLILKVPVGTQVYEEDQKTLLFDLIKENQEYIIAKGGGGGLGNSKFKSSTNRSPRKFTYGKIGEELIVWLELKLIADVGIIGFPNAGKSSLLSISTRARPKIANYPFTTLNPNLGVVNIDDREIVLADIPGLIEGAHNGLGLGDKFLKHIERCKSIIHMIDITEENLTDKYKIIRNELKSFNPELMKKKELIVFNKIDLINEEEKKEKIANFIKKTKKKVYDISVEKKINVKSLLRAIK
jgi:GTP-binding protein